MRIVHRLCLVALGSAASLPAQNACTPGALPDAAKAVAAVRRQLHGQAVGESDPNVPTAISTQLGQLKAALASAADAAFACAQASATPEELQKTLTVALHIDPATATGTVTTRNGKDYGAYGSDLSVQVLQLFNRPKYLEVDFRYGIECGDDNLLMVFEVPDQNSAAAWQERLRWSAPAYTTVGDAMGDFVMLTPLTGSYKNPTWRFVVAHGHPSCHTGAHPSQFDLDLLSPTPRPAEPKVDWHFVHPYTEDHAVPRLATTEDTVDFRITHEAAPGKATTATPPEIFRFQLTPEGRLEPLAPVAEDGPRGATAREATQPVPATSPQ